MPIAPKEPSAKRRSVNLTIREDVIKAARSYGLNASQAAEAGILQAIRSAQATRWLTENQAAIDTHNARVEGDGTLLAPAWADET